MKKNLNKYFINIQNIRAYPNIYKNRSHLK